MCPEIVVQFPNGRPLRGKRLGANKRANRANQIGRIHKLLHKYASFPSAQKGSVCQRFSFGPGGPTSNPSHEPSFACQRSVANVICQDSSICGAAICRVRDPRNLPDLGKATEGDGGSPLCTEPASIVHHPRITLRRGPAYLRPSRVALPMHTPLLDSGGTGPL